MQKGRSILICVLIAFICLFGMIMFQNLSAEIFIKLGWEVRKEVNLFANGYWVAFFIFAIAYPLIEEFIFRFLICKGLKYFKLNNGIIIAISAVIFMIYHMSWSQTIYQLIMGIFFAWIFLKTNNISWTLLIHFLNNAIIITYTYITGATNQIFQLSPLNIILAITLAIASVVSVIFLIKKGLPNAKRQ